LHVARGEAADDDLVTGLLHRLLHDVARQLVGEAAQPDRRPHPLLVGVLGDHPGPVAVAHLKQRLDLGRGEHGIEAQLLDQRPGTRFTARRSSCGSSRLASGDSRWPWKTMSGVSVPRLNSVVHSRPWAATRLGMLSCPW